MFSVSAYLSLVHVSRLRIHVSPYVWLPLGLSQLRRWHGLSEGLSPHQARAVCLPHCSQQSPGPKPAAGQTLESFGPSHYTLKPFSNTVIDMAITEYKQHKYKYTAHAKHMWSSIFTASIWLENIHLISASSLLNIWYQYMLANFKSLIKFILL